MDHQRANANGQAAGPAPHQPTLNTIGDKRRVVARPAEDAVHARPRRSAAYELGGRAVDEAFEADAAVLAGEQLALRDLRMWLVQHVERGVGANPRTR